MDLVTYARTHLRSDRSSPNYYIGTDGMMVYGKQKGLDF